jgi:uncharacterized protein
MPDASAITLPAFLEASTRPPDTLKYHELQGFLFAVASAPELITPSEWLPIVVGELMALYNAVNAAVYEDRAALPADCPVRHPALANLDDDAPLHQWSHGFLRGHQWLEESWDPYIPEDLDEDFGSILLTLSFFTSKELAQAYCEEAGNRDLAEMAMTVCSVFSEALVEYAHLGRSIQRAIAATEASERRRAPSKKIGRNEPCPCGSGRKYKRCCGITPT